MNKVSARIHTYCLSPLHGFHQQHGQSLRSSLIFNYKITLNIVFSLVDILCQVVVTFINILLMNNITLFRSITMFCGTNNIP